MNPPAETPLNVLWLVLSLAGLCLCFLAGEDGVWLCNRLRRGKKWHLK